MSRGQLLLHLMCWQVVVAVLVSTLIIHPHDLIVRGDYAIVQGLLPRYRRVAALLIIDTVDAIRIKGLLHVV